MNDNIKRFANYEDANKSHKNVASSILMCVILISPFVYICSNNAKWLFYSLIPGILIGVIWGIKAIPHVDYDRRQYYLYSGIMRIFCCFPFCHLAFGILITFLNVSISFLIFAYIIIVGLIVVLYLFNKKAIEKGKANKNYSSLSFGACLSICIISRILAKNWASVVGENIILIVASFLFIYAAFAFLNLGVRDFLKYQFIKQIENKNEVF